jgi:hypothetical protein
MHTPAPALAFGRAAAALLLLAALLGCTSTAEQREALTRQLRQNDPTILERIRAFEAGRVADAAGVTSDFGPDGRPVYLFRAPCCDRYDQLFDTDGRYLCAPTGGFAGGGDGRCPAWAKELRYQRQPGSHDADRTKRRKSAS